MEKMKPAVLAYCQEACPIVDSEYVMSPGTKLVHRMLKGDWTQWELQCWNGGTCQWERAFCANPYMEGDDPHFGYLYRILGLEKIDILEAERAFWTASTDALTKSLEAEKVKNANLQQQLEEAQNVKFEGMASPAWAMFGEFTKFMEETMDSDTPRTTSWCIRLEDGREVTLMNIWAATSHDSPITRATELRDMLQQVLNHSNRPEMDDSQFRMFALENINHLLYGNKEGKKDE